MRTELVEKYYKEQKPEKRKAILDQMFEENSDIEANQIRKELFELRYNYKRKQFADQFMGLWVTLRMYAIPEVGERDIPKACKTIEKEMDKISYLTYNNKEGLEKELFIEEWKHMLYLYAKVCETDKNYNSTIFGFIKLEQESIENKLRKDINQIGFRLPKLLGMEAELASVTEACQAVLEDL